MRQARIERATKETQVVLELALDGRGAAEVATGIGFLDHMLTLSPPRANLPGTGCLT